MIHTMTDLAKKVQKITPETVPGHRYTSDGILVEYIDKRTVLSLIAKAQKPVVWTEQHPVDEKWKCECGLVFHAKYPYDSLELIKETFSACPKCLHPIGEFREYKP